MYLEELKKLIESALALTPLSLSSQDGIASGPLYERLLLTSAALRSDTGSLSVRRLRDLQKQAIIHHLTLGEPLQPSYSVLAALLAGDKVGILGFEHRDEWRAAIRAALDYNAAYPIVYQADNIIETQNGRALNVARSIVTLQAAGFKVTFVDGQFADVQQLREIETVLAARIDENPAAHLELLLRHLSRVYSVEADRYNFVRVFQSSAVQKEHGALPIGFLYLLTITAINVKTTALVAELATESMVRAAETWDLYTAYSGVLDVEFWNLFEATMTDSGGIVRHLRDRVLYEQNFALRQQTPMQTLSICELVFAPLNNEEFASVRPFKLDDAVTVIRAILERRSGPGVLRLNANAVAQACGLPLEPVTLILNALSRDARSTQTTELSFFDLSAGDAMYVPLVRTQDECYLQIDRLLAGPAFYEAIAAAFRGALPSGQLDNIVGKVGLEGAIRTLLSRHGLTVFSGAYGSEDLECDAVVETRDSIIFLEAKKKGLTRKSLSGQAEAVLFDVSESIIEAQVQLARHEYSIRRDGKLEFHDGRRLELNGRRIDRVAVTLLDLGSLQDKIVVANMLTHLRGARLHTDRSLDHRGRRAKAAFEKTADELLKYFNLIGSLVPDYHLVERFTVRSYALCELIELLSDVSGPEELAANIAVDRHLTSGIGDWFAEYHHWKQSLKA